VLLRLAERAEIDRSRQLGHAAKLTGLDVVRPDVAGIDGRAELEREDAAVP
jgi:hypothetical protein